MKTRPVFPPEQYYITDRQLWRALRVPPGVEHRHLLVRAIRAGRSGRETEGFALLKTYYRTRTEGEWVELRYSAMRESPDTGLVQRLLGRDITLAHGMQVQFKERIDFSSRQSGHDAMLWLQALGWMAPVVSHFARTNDPGARDFLVSTTADFYRDRDKVPPDTHYAWGSLGFDAASTVLRRALVALLHTGDAPDAFLRDLLKYVLGAGRKVFPFVSRFILHNIHTSGCWALFKAARFYPELNDAREWERISLAHLARHTDRSFYPDGCHIERCWGYGWHTLHRLSDAYHFAMKTGGLGRHGRSYLANLRRGYAWFVRTAAPGGMMPGYGDDPPMSVDPILEAALKLFPRTHRSLCRQTGTSCFEPASGFAFFRNGKQNTSVFANVTFGEYAGWHAHFDSLSFNLSLGSTPLLVELSRFGSYGHPLDHIFRSPEAHNQMLVDGHPYDNRFQPACGDVVWKSTGDIDYFSATHRAYRNATDPEGLGHRCYVAAEELIVRRTILFVKDPGYFVILDSVRHPDPSLPFVRAVSGWWHSATPCRTLGPTQAVTTGNPGCVMAWAHPETIRRLDTGWDFDRTIQSAGERNSYSLRARAWTSQTSRDINGLVTVLLPFRGTAPHLRVRALPTQDGQRYRAEALEVRIRSRAETVILNPERLPGFVFDGHRVTGRAEVRTGRSVRTIRVP